MIFKLSQYASLLSRRHAYFILLFAALFLIFGNCCYGGSSEVRLSSCLKQQAEQILSEENGGYFYVTLYSADKKQNVSSPAKLIVENPDDLKTGYDTDGGVYYEEIPKSSMSSIWTEVFEVINPAIGNYGLYVQGVLPGLYNLEIKIFSLDKLLASRKFENVQIDKDSFHRYSVNYKSGMDKEISIGLSDHGGRPKKQTKVLSYKGINDNYNELSANTSSYSLKITYGDAILPSTFMAFLNGQDISGQFNPQKEANEIVNIPLPQGESNLIICVQFEHNNDLVLTKDTLSFFVPETSTPD
jgi:hypothetical protein